MTYLETTMKEDGCTLNAAIRDTLTDLMHLCTIHHIGERYCSPAQKKG